MNVLPVTALSCLEMLLDHILACKEADGCKLEADCMTHARRHGYQLHVTYTCTCACTAGLVPGQARRRSHPKAFMARSRFRSKKAANWQAAASTAAIASTVTSASMSAGSVASLRGDIEALQGRCTTLRRSLGHTVPSDAEAKAALIAAVRGEQAEASLLQLRESKAAELQMLSLQCCGKSTRHCHGAAGPRGSRFNLRLQLAVADCMSQLQRENRALRKDRELAAGGGGAPSTSTAAAGGRDLTANNLGANLASCRPPPAWPAPRPASAGASVGRGARPEVSPSSEPSSRKNGALSACVNATVNATANGVNGRAALAAAAAAALLPHDARAGGRYWTQTLTLDVALILTLIPFRAIAQVRIHAVRAVCHTCSTGQPPPSVPPRRAPFTAPFTAPPALARAPSSQRRSQRRRARRPVSLRSVTAAKP